MMELTALDVHYAVRELSTLVGARLDKIVQSDTDKRDVLFTLSHNHREGKMHLRFLLPHMLCAHDEKPTHYPQIPPGFAMFLRKYIGGIRLESVTQRGFDRVIDLRFRGKTGTWTLVVEMLAPGNMILVGDDGKIKNLLENQHYKDRSLRGGLAYEAPPAAFNIVTASDAEMTTRIKDALRGNAAAALATALGLGGAYAMEVCARAGIENEATLSETDIEKLVIATRALLDHPIAPHRDEHRVWPFLLTTKPATPCVQATFLAALGSAVESHEAKELHTPTVSTGKPKKSKLQVMLDAQEANLIALERVAQDQSVVADRIYEEYALVADVIGTAQTARKEKADVAHALKRITAVKRYDTATATAELEFTDR